MAKSERWLQGHLEIIKKDDMTAVEIKKDEVLTEVEIFQVTKTHDSLFVCELKSQERQKV